MINEQLDDEHYDGLEPMTDQEALAHSGVLRKSGRYPWGSGENPNQRNKQFLNYIDDLKKKGLSDVEIVKGMGIMDTDDPITSTTQLRALKSMAKNAVKADQISQAQRLKEKNLSNIAIGEKMGLNESSVRALLAPSTKVKNDELLTTANMLKDQVATKKYLDVGVGTENLMGVSGTKLSTAVEMLKEEGYGLHHLNVPQQGTGEMTRMKVLVGPDTTFKELAQNKSQIKPYIDSTSVERDKTVNDYGLRAPTNVSSKKIAIRYAEDGGTDMDGVMELRRGAKDLDLGNKRYAQVRIAVDGTHYIKGMAIYADDLPDDTDIRFNTNKSKDVSKMDVLKPMKKDKEGNIDIDNPFGSQIKAGGQRGALNIVNEEGDWITWSKKLSSQMLSKQKPELAKEQLGLSFDLKKKEYDEIVALTNPAVKKKLLDSFADDADSSAVHLKAAGLPRTSSHVILPIKDMKETEIYAPQYRNGEKVVLIRHPHGGTFEIPELTVNNRQATAKGILQDAIDAVGIHPKVAEQLSGADFDGDTVLVIPNRAKPGGGRAVTTSAPLKALKGFDPKAAYPKFDGMKLMDTRETQHQMGNISNLITDMTIMGAPMSEIARAVKHSMVVIDAEKHKLNWKQSAQDNNIAELKKKYQGGTTKGAATLVSRAKSEQRVPHRKPRPIAQGGPIDPLTGEKKYVDTGKSYVVPEKTVKDSKGRIKVIPEHVVFNEIKSTKMAEARDANDLVSANGGTVMERVYADHANKLKAIGNDARKSSYNTKPIPYSPSAKIAYANEVASLKAKLNIAQKNAPIERQAQLLAGATVAAKRQANPDMDDDEIKKARGQALTAARLRTGASKERVDITPNEWSAIQSGAISNNFLNKILSNADLDQVKSLATPHTPTHVMSTSLVSRAKGMLANGFTQAEVADALGVPTSTLNDSIKNG